MSLTQAELIALAGHFPEAKTPAAPVMPAAPVAPAVVPVVTLQACAQAGPMQACPVVGPTYVTGSMFVGSFGSWFDNLRSHTNQELDTGYIGCLLDSVGQILSAFGRSFASIVPIPSGTFVFRPINELFGLPFNVVACADPNGLALYSRTERMVLVNELLAIMQTVNAAGCPVFADTTITDGSGNFIAPAITKKH